MLERIKTVMKLLHINKSDVASAIGYSPSQVSLITTGHSKMQDKFLRSFCSRYHVSESWIRLGEGDIFDDSDTDETIFWNVLKDKLRAVTPEARTAISELGALLVKAVKEVEDI